jgi:hypothetical protein
MTAMFTKDSYVLVKQLDAPEFKSMFWELEHPLVYEGARETFTVDPPFDTDFASVPKVFVWFLPRYGRYTRAAILHDSLWKRARAGGMAWRDADGLFRRAMHELNVPFLKRWIMWTAVRWGALAHLREGGGAGWWRDAPLVLLFTLVSAPILFPAAAVVFVSLLLFFVYEAIVWAALALGRAVKTLFGKQPTKKLNRPSLSMKL